MRRLIPLLLAAAICLPSLAVAAGSSSTGKSDGAKYAFLGLGGKNRAKKAPKAKKAKRSKKAGKRPHRPRPSR